MTAQDDAEVVAQRPVVEQPAHTRRARTAAVMHGTAEALERSEAALHRRADAARDSKTTQRLDDLGDRVTAQAKDLERRARRLTD